MSDETVVQTVNFRPDGTVEIAYLEVREQHEGAGMMRTVGFNPELFPSEVAALRSELAVLIDEILLYIRNPDVKKDRMTELKKQALTEQFLEAASD